MESQTKIKYTEQKQSKEHIFQALQSSASIQNQLIKKKAQKAKHSFCLCTFCFFFVFFWVSVAGWCHLTNDKAPLGWHTVNRYMLPNYSLSKRHKSEACRNVKKDNRVGSKSEEGEGNERGRQIREWQIKKKKNRLGLFCYLRECKESNPRHVK